MFSDRFQKLTINIAPKQFFENTAQKTNTPSISILTTNLLLTLSRICFSLRAMISPFCFFTRFFSSFLQAYIFPEARTWHAHTSPNPPFPKTRYSRNVSLVTGRLWMKKKHWKHYSLLQTCCLIADVSDWSRMRHSVLFRFGFLVPSSTAMS